MEKIIFADKTEFEIMPGASLDNITVVCENFTTLGVFTEALTKAGNLKTIEFKQDTLIVGKYEDMILESDIFYNVKTTKDKKVNATFSIRPMTKIELQIAGIQNDQLVQDGAIMDLAEMVGGAM
nr:hypothetical protein [uncultured Blautia sp.]